MDLLEITIEPVTYNWWLMCIPFYIMELCLLLLLVLDRFDRVPSWLIKVFIAIGATSLGVGVGILIILGVSHNSQAIMDHQQTALHQQLNWSHVVMTADYDGNTFVAKSDDGLYVSGKLVATKKQDTYAVLLDK